FVPEGLEATVRKSKTDQEGRGAVKEIPFGSDPATCPVRAMKAWLESAGIVEGAVFRELGRGQVLGERLSTRAVARIVKRAARAAGLDPAKFSGHSLRRGLATSAAKAGKDRASIKRAGGWRSDATVARYVAEAERWDDVAAAGIGL